MEEAEAVAINELRVTSGENGEDTSKKRLSIYVLSFMCYRAAFNVIAARARV